MMCDTNVKITKLFSVSLNYYYVCLQSAGAKTEKFSEHKKSIIEDYINVIYKLAES